MIKDEDLCKQVLETLTRAPKEDHPGDPEQWKVTNKKEEK